MSRSTKTAMVLKGNKKQTASLSPGTAKKVQKNQQPKIALVIPSNDYTDRHGRTYHRDPDAKMPYTGHVIRYPDGEADEDLPIQVGDENQVGINGASPLLLAIGLLKSLESKSTSSHYVSGAKIFLEMAAKMLLAEDMIEKDLQTIYTPEQLTRLKLDLDALKLLNATDTIQRLLTSMRDKITTLEKNMGGEVRAYVKSESEPSAELEPVLKYIGTSIWENDSPVSS